VNWTTRSKRKKKWWEGDEHLNAEADVNDTETIGKNYLLLHQ
jgi:hypothetical protein